MKKGNSSPLADLRRYAEFLAATIDADEARRAVASAIGRVPLRSIRWRARIAATLAALVTLAGANAGLAVASDSAVPGDELYFFKRAYERVGPVIGFEVDPASERLEEAVVLVHRGDVPRSLSLTGEALANFEDVTDFQDARQALQDAVEEARLLHGTLGTVMSVDFRRDARDLVDIAGSMVQARREGQDLAQYVEHLYLSARRVADQARTLRVSTPEGQQEQSPPAQPGDSSGPRPSPGLGSGPSIW
ncbi:MAG: hypothetical protein M3N51_02245 [Actinomycetota bacterium]|nr:hypothetical protein [Actinomycetota bacterium]